MTMKVQVIPWIYIQSKVMKKELSQIFLVGLLIVLSWWSNYILNDNMAIKASNGI